MTKNETFFELTLNDLLEDTLYWYYYELFPYEGVAFNTDRKTFHTQAYNAPVPPTPPSVVPEGALSGLFSVSPTQKVYISKGNLQYQASTNTWRFAENQWDYVGDGTYGTVYENGVKCNNELVSPTYNGWIDVFGWGTSGWNNGNVYYQPYDWQRTEDISHGNGYGPIDAEGNLYELTGDYSRADWGSNAIANGGGQEGLWRCLKFDEWIYLSNYRNTVSGLRFVKALVEGEKVVVFLPDNWSLDWYSFNEPNQTDGNFSNNIISADQWSVLEQKGAALMPVSGIRSELWMNFIGEQSHYWLSTDNHSSSSDYADIMAFNDYGVGAGQSSKTIGNSVRLVQDATR